MRVFVCALHLFSCDLYFEGWIRILVRFVSSLVRVMSSCTSSRTINRYHSVPKHKPRLFEQLVAKPGADIIGQSGIAWQCLCCRCPPRRLLPPHLDAKQIPDGLRVFLIGEGNVAANPSAVEPISYQAHYAEGIPGRDEVYLWRESRLRQHKR